MPLRLWIGNIVELKVDAIVNAANQSLLGGGGVDGAIHRAAGPGLLAECRTLGGCLPGDAKMTAGYDLPARHVIHTVGPVWHGGAAGEDQVLASCYRSVMALVLSHGLTSVAFPAISTGVYGFPKDRAATIAVRTIREVTVGLANPPDVILCAFSEQDGHVVRNAIAAAPPSANQPQ
ncbi:MAG: O-acetyl-ADP-ribose deacetylase [Pseudorhodobacter sp.]|nr:O-acetyl-ADP-ribose deacetylase [Pseudorhodobacter sp.]